jgi:CshA-type fibril repeat protein
MHVIRRFGAFVIALMAALAPLPVGPAQAAGGAVTETSSVASTTAGSQVTLTATAPIQDAGTFTQSIVQTIDPTKVKLTGLSDIAYPQGWTLSYSTDGSTFTATTPTSSAAWAAVRAVKATGSLATEGSDNGRQVAQSTVSAATVNLAPPTQVVASEYGDGFQAFFDPGRTLVFNLSHHSSALTKTLDCHVIATGATCTGFPFITGAATQEAAYGTVVGTKIWVPANFNGIGGLPTGTGMRCVDIAAVLSSGGQPQMCSTPYVVFGSTNAFPTHFTGGSTSGVAAETKLYLLQSTTANATIYCLDTASMAACPTASLNPGIAGKATQTLDASDILKSGDLIYVSVADDASDTVRLSCVLASTGSMCPGWSAGRLTFSKSGSSAYLLGGRFFELPDASGGTRGVCYQAPSITGITDRCWAPDGVEFAASTYNVPRFAGNFSTIYGSPVRQGTRVYFGNGFWQNDTGAEFWCYDAAANGGAGGRCNGASTSFVQQNYTVTPDPAIANCVWIARHFSPVLKTFNLLTGTDGCSSISPRRAVFSGQTAVPRMGCSSTAAIDSWKSFTLDTPTSGFTSATLTVQTESGSDIVGWTGVSLTPGVPIDLSTLSVTTSGQRPSFVVDVIGASGTITPSARVSAVGDAPQLCLTVTALAVCPSGSGPVPTLSATSFSGTGSGTVTDSGNVTTAFSPATTSVTVGALSTSQCGSTMTGTVTLTGTSTPIAGATVALLDSAGNPVLVNGVPVTTTSAADGTYSFGFLLPGTYKVKFSDAGVTTAETATITSGGSGTVTDGECSSGTSSAIVTNLSWITGPDAGVRTAPTNLVTNGDFTDTGSFSTPPHLFWGEKTVQSTARLEVNAAVMGSPVVPYPNAVAIGTNGEAIPGWTAAGGGVRTYATIGPLPNRGTTLGLTPNIVYFGNGQSTSVSPAVSWTAQGWSRQSLTVSNSNSEYGNSSGLTLSQTIATTVGQRYRFQFHQLAEQDQSNDGIAAIDITGYGRTFFAVKKATRRIGLEFVATSSSTTFTFVAWGHLSLATELAIDDVTLNPCTPYVISGTATIAVGTNAVVNAAYDTPAVASPDTSTGAQGVAQTINVKSNDTASTGANLTSPTIRFCTTDSPASGCTLTTKTVSGQGIYTISGGNVIFTPCSASGTPAGAGCTGAFTGTATPIAYQITDSAGSASTSTITPTVIPVPTAVNDTSSGNYNTAQTKNILTNDTAGTGATLTASTIRLCNPNTSPAQTPNNCTVAAGSTITVANVGTYSVNATGVITFTPVASYYGTPPALSYQVQDSIGQYASATYTPTVLPPPQPTTAADASTGLSGAAQTVNPLTNDVVGATGVTFTASTVKLCGTGQTVPTCTATSVVVPGQGTYTVNATTGEITFTPCSGVNTPTGASCTGVFGGTATPVRYQVSTNTSQVASNTYTPTVIPPPTAAADTGTGNWDINQTFTPTSNDTAGPGTSLKPVPSGICVNGTAIASCTATTLTVANQGTYTLNTTTGVVTFDPLPSFAGTATPIQYVVSDVLNQKSAGTITPTVTSPPAPAASPETKVVAPGGTITFTTLTGSGGLAATGGPDFTTSATCLVNTSVTPNTCVTSLTISGEGTYTLNTSTGVVTFVALAGITSGTKTPISYRVTDATGQTATSTLTPIVPPPPTLSNDASINEQNATQVINVLANDTASAYSSLSATTVKLCPSGATAPFNATNCNLSTLTVPNEGVYTVNSNGTVSFVPCNAAPDAACPANTKYSGVATTVRYVAQDNLGQFGSATITPTVLPPPVAQASNDAESAPFAQPVSFSPLANDTGGTTTGLVGYTSTGTATLDPTSVRLCAAGESAPDCTATTLNTVDGTYSVNTSTGSITFTPATNFSGTPMTPPSYMVCNVIGGNWQPMAPPASCASALVTPTIAPPTSPSAVNDVSTGAYNTPQTIPVLTNDTKDPALTFVASSVRLCGSGQTPPNCTLTTLTIPGEGTYTVNADGSVMFTPVNSFTGTVSSPPTYQVTDSFGAKTSATITPTVSPPPAPTATPETQQVVPGGTATFTDLIGSGGLASGTGLQTGNAAGPCLVDPSDSVCKDTFTVTGQGTWTVNRITGTVTFDADPGATSGTKTPVTYRVTDVTGQTATSTLTPVIPPAPTATNDTSIDALDVTQTIDVLSNDAAGTGTTFVASTVRLCGVSGAQTAPNCTQQSVMVAGEGTYTVNPDGTVTFDPLPTFVGTATPVDYQVTDSLGRTVSASITPTVTSTPPTAVPDTVELAAGTSATFSPLFGTGGLVTSDASGPALVPNTSCLVDPATRTCGLSVTIAGEGTYTLDRTTGVVTYVSLATAAAGQKTPVTYRIADATGFVASSTLTPTVWPKPSASPDTSTGEQGATQVLNPLANDSAGSPARPLDSSSILLCGPGESGTGCTKTTVTVPNEGTYTVGSDGTVTFVPTATFTGVATPIDYTVRDTVGQIATSTITVTVREPVGSSGTNDVSTPTTATIPNTSTPERVAGTPSKPRVVRQHTQTTPEVPAFLNPATFGKPSKGATFVISKTRIWDATEGVWSTSVSTSQGTWKVIRDKVRFVPAKGFTGTARVPFRMVDSSGRSAKATLSVVVSDASLPATGSQPAGPVTLAMLLVASGAVICRRRRATGSSPTTTLPTH